MAAQAAGKANIVSTPQEPQQPGWNPPPVPPPPAAPPQQGAPQPGEPQYGAPQYGAPQYAAPQHGAPQYAPPPYGQQPAYDAGQFGQQPPPPPYDGGQFAPPPPPPPYDGGQYGGQFGQPGAPAPKSRKTLWILLGVIGGVVLLVVVGVVLLINLVGNATGKAKGQAEEFTKLLVAGQHEEAYDRFLTDALKEDLPKASFVRGINGLDLDDSCKPTYNSVESSSENGKTKAEVSGTLDCDGRIIELRYGFVGNDLKLDAIRIKPRA